LHEIERGLNPFYASELKLFDFHLFRFSLGETTEEVTRKGKSKSCHYIQVSNATSGLSPFYASELELFDFQIFRFSLGETTEEVARKGKSKSFHCIQVSNAIFRLN
jgi:hypothetical protein